MPKCHLCNREYEDGANYCAQCGARLDDREAMGIPTSSDWAATEELLTLSRAMSSTLDPQLLLTRIEDSAVRLTGAAAGSILLFNEDGSLRFRISSGEKAPIAKSLTVTDGIAWWVAKHGEAARVKDVSEDRRFTGAVDRITGFQTRSILCVPMTLGDSVIGTIEVLNKKSEDGFTNDDKRLLSVLANQAAVAINNAKLATEQRNFFTHVIEILVNAIESTRLIPEGHCWEVAKLAIAMGRRFGLGDQDLQDLYYAAALHDLGVLGLRRSEQHNMESHPMLGARMVSTIDMLHGTEPIIRHHHEHFDGSGYPEGLAGEEIPLAARIVSVVEAYEEAISEGESSISARAYIQSNSGKLFDPKVVNEFLELKAFNED
jgi:hypothetical protein